MVQRIPWLIGGIHDFNDRFIGRELNIEELICTWKRVNGPRRY